MVKSVGRGGASLGSPDWLDEFARDLLDLGLGETGGVGRFGTKKIVKYYIISKSLKIIYHLTCHDICIVLQPVETFQVGFTLFNVTVAFRT